MDIDKSNFRHRLLDILHAISDADFVAIDLEFSGIPNRIPNRPARKGQQSIEDRYQETKMGAERYQVLQLGLTCARFDYSANRYVLRPYNIWISPLVDDERLGIEREISFQTGAIQFLMENGMSMDTPFRRGVQYLSREEAKRARQEAHDRIDKKTVYEDSQLKETEIDALDFVRRVREEVKKFEDSDNMSLAINRGIGTNSAHVEWTISSYERRLVYQTLRAEFPTLVGISRDDHIKVIRYDAMREEDRRKRSKRQVDDRIMAQTGCRWLVEALAGGDLDLKPHYFAKDKDGQSIMVDMDFIRGKVRAAALRAKTRRPVLVGHNMFTDIVYFYKCFIGELPETSKEFCQTLHELFPRIVDTKYLATATATDSSRSPTLHEIALEHYAQPLPRMVQHSDHTKYENAEVPHEAGFDSLLTAGVMLRLSTSLEVDEQQSTSDASVVTASDLSASAPEFIPSFSPPRPAAPAQAVFVPDADAPEFVPALRPVKANYDTRVAQGDNGQVQKLATRFASHNPYATLEQADKETLSKPNWKEVPSEPTRPGVPIVTSKREPMEIMPDFESSFWKKYGNKLRVFGTHESFLQIAEWR
ncbi:CAF1-domain-containing protein [Sporormia fimetaria CBS 119925]|uniref:CAF1-domain-containing protein n=1 Tax=Sporormia fimetaria CBS 119925 TaxID=1340428 RepID=A0A6A6VNY4_9PLEO|nr:CAF1-domain-containing protein [Sporormia fimetaria CBS 119925]